MSNSIRFCLVLHNHQPIGNFDHVFEQAYQDSYLPFLDVFENYPALRISLHTSGPLMEWLDERHPDYLDRLAELVGAGRIEIIGGPFYEPILTMIPSRDRIGQISMYTKWLESRLGSEVRGMWMPERVWEQSLASDLHRAAIEYTVLDDFHFLNAGLTHDQLHGYFVTEDDGETVCVFPGSEQLRYLIPFGDPQHTIDHLRYMADRFPNAVAVFGDDGEKFGTWPGTKTHCYHDGWLRRFFDALSANQQWLHTTTLADAVENVSPVGNVYLPDASYREMTEWALPVDLQLEYDAAVHDLQHDDRWPRIKRFVRGGFWRNFKVKYTEANEMYSRMMMVSRRLAQAVDNGHSGDEIYWAERELYRGQCNCSYWHGAFGGIYLPHLRNAVYNHLIAADNLLDQATGTEQTWTDVSVEDFNFDARREVRLANDKLVALLAPAAGAHLYELDVRSICLNLQAGLARRPEAYHQKVRAGGNQDGDDCASIHDRVVMKQDDLDQRLHYDSLPRHSLIDHFYSNETSLDSVLRCDDGIEQGDFARGVYDIRLRKSQERKQLVMAREGLACGVPLRITKGVAVESGSEVLKIDYLLEGLPTDRDIHFAVEWNFAGLPSGADDRYFHLSQDERLGQLGKRLDLHHEQQLGLVDQWQGIDVRLGSSQPCHFWTFPVETVSQSEAGIELVQQCVAVFSRWYIRGDADGRWSVSLELSLDTSEADSRHQALEEAVVP